MATAPTEAVTRTFLDADGTLTTATFSPDDLNSVLEVSSASEIATATSTDGVEVFTPTYTPTTTTVRSSYVLIATTTVINGVSYVATFTSRLETDEPTSQSDTAVPTPSNVPDSCQNPCAEAVSLIGEYGPTSDLCASEFRDHVDTCIACLNANNIDAADLQQWEEALAPGLKQCKTSSGPNVGAIAGGTVGGVLTLILFGVLVIFVRKRRRHDLNGRSKDSVRVWMKPELHADDCQPQRKELEGSNVPSDHLEKRKPMKVSELPANEEVQRARAVKMSSNGTPNIQTASELASTPGTRP